MTAYENLDSHYLAGIFGPDYWSDEAIELARRVLTQFTEDDWKKLSSEWPAKPAEWQERCADMLGYANPHFAQPILKDMVKSKYSEVAEMAQESLTIKGKHAQ